VQFDFGEEWQRKKNEVCLVGFLQAEVDAMNWFEIVMSGLTAVYVGATIFYAVVARKTLGAIERQADLTEKQGNSSAEQFSQQLSAMVEARTQTGELIRQATAQAAALIKVAEATEKNAEAAKASADALRASVEVSINEKRARIKISAENVVPQSQSAGPGVRNCVVCWFMNYGLTTAVIIDSRARYFLSADPNVVPDYSQCRQLLYAESLLPDERSNNFLLQLEPTSDLTDDDVMKIRKGEFFLHFYGFVRHQDTFGRRWKTTIHTRWKMRWGGVIDGAVIDYWEPNGPPEENQETEEE
jgi:hypothetical protein